MVGIQDWFKQQRLKNRLVFDLFVESGIIQRRFNEYLVNPGRWLVDGFGRSRKWRRSSDPTSLKMFFFSEYERLAMNKVCFLSSKRIGHWVKISQSSPAWGSSEPLCPSPAQSGSLRWIASREARDVNGDVKATDVICELESCQYSWEVDSNYLDTCTFPYAPYMEYLPTFACR